MCFITHLNNNKFHIKVYLVISSELDLQPSKGLSVPSHPMFPYMYALSNQPRVGQKPILIISLDLDWQQV